MKGHPGGREHSLRMLELAALPHGVRILDMGAGAGETLALLRESGFDAVGIDLSPRAPEVLRAVPHSETNTESPLFMARTAFAPSFPVECEPA